VVAPTQRLQLDTPKAGTTAFYPCKMADFPRWRADCNFPERAETVLDLARLNWFDNAAPKQH
jgi:hypothetical protein